MSTCGECQDFEAISIIKPICGICRASGSEVELLQGVCPPRRRELEALAKAERLKDEAELEKKRRVYYQDIVYYACNVIDAIFKPILGCERVVCGCLDAPTRGVQESMDKIKKLMQVVFPQKE